MTPYAATLTTALALLLLGGLLLWNGSPVAAIARGFPRSRRAAIATIAVGAAWTLYHVTRLGESDFGKFRVIIFLAFAALAVLSVMYVPDFLAVRGACVLVLLIGDVLLSAGYMRYELPGHTMLNALVYLMIALSFYLAISPFRLRDFFQWLFARANRARAFGGVLTAYGLVLFVAALQQ